MGWLTSGSARTLVIEFDEFSLRAAVVNVALRNPRVEAIASVQPRNVWTALPALLERLSNVRIPRQAIVLTSDVVPTVMRLPMASGKSRTWFQMQQILRWEFDALLAQHFLPRPLGEIMVCRGLLTDEQYRSIRGPSPDGSSGISSLSDRGIESLLEAAVLEHGRGSRADLDECLVIQERLERPLVDDQLVCGWSPPAHLTEPGVDSRSADGLYPWFASGLQRSTRDNWREELARLGLRLVGIGPLVGCVVPLAMSEGTGPKTAIVEIRPGRIGLTEVLQGRIDSVQSLPVPYAVPTPEQLEEYLRPMAVDTVWLTGIHPELTPIAETLSKSLDRDVKVLGSVESPPAGESPGSVAAMVGAALSASPKSRRGPRLATVVGRDPAPPLRKRPGFWWVSVACLTLLLIGGVEFLLRHRLEDVSNFAMEERGKLALKKAAADEIQLRTETIKNLNSEIAQLKESAGIKDERITFLDKKVPERVRFVPALLTAIVGASSESIAINQISESVAGTMEIEAWALTTPAAQRYIQSLETKLKTWGLQMEEPRVQSQIGRLNLPGYLIELEFSQPEDAPDRATTNDVSQGATDRQSTPSAMPPTESSEGDEES